jgi:hypothetical protein
MDWNWLKIILIKESTYQVGEEQRNCYIFTRKWTLLFEILWTKQYYYLVELKYFK